MRLVQAPHHATNIVGASHKNLGRNMLEQSFIQRFRDYFLIPTGKVMETRVNSKKSPLEIA